MKIGITLHPRARGLEYAMEEAKRADDQGFDSVWNGDHLVTWRGEDGPDGPLDSFTLMTAIGAVTSRVRVAWAMLNVSFR